MKSRLRGELRGFGRFLALCRALRDTAYTLADQVTPEQWAAKYHDAQAAAARATKLELARDYDAAFKTYLAAAQTYMFLLRHTTDPEIKQRIRTVSGKLVERAGKIKQANKLSKNPVAKNDLSIEEQDSVLASGSLISGHRLARWTPGDACPSSTSAALPSPPMSPAQLMAGCTWVRAAVVFPQAVVAKDTTRGKDILQDNVSDCSIVTALMVAAEHNARFRSRLALSCLFPQDSSGLPITSEDGRYNVRFLVNGTWRSTDIIVVQIPIDDTLPVTPEKLPMCALVKDQDQLGPALLEKAYLTIMGGYDFAGSNSANDLYAISGWIPENIPLRRRLRSEGTWHRLSRGFYMGKCVLTLGTSADDAGSGGLDLIPSHSYAVIGKLNLSSSGCSVSTHADRVPATDVRETGDRRQLVLVNPWRSDPPESTWTSGLRDTLPSAEDPEVMVIDWEDVPASFAFLNVNWDPASFDYTDRVHLSLPAHKGSDTPVTAQKRKHLRHLRLRVEPDAACESDVWLLLARHTANPLEKNEFISLDVALASAISRQDGVVALPPPPASAMTDNLYDLYRFMPEAGASVYDVTIAHEGPSPTFAFTLTALSNCNVRILDGSPPLPYKVEVGGAWTATTAGGNHTCHTFYRNPQYLLKLDAPISPGAEQQRIEVLAETDKETPINVRLLYADGKRVDHFANRDVLAGESTYNYGRASCARDEVSPGRYTLVVSSFQPDHLASFKVAVRSSLPVEIAAIPPEGAGMFSRRVDGAWVPGQAGGKSQPLENPRFRLRLAGTANVKIRLQTPERPLELAVSIYASDSSGQPAQLVASSGPYVDHVCGAVLSARNLPLAASDYIVIPSTARPKEYAAFEMLVYASTKLEVSPL
ncbi:cysteine proteinase [Rhodotorula sp. JG-1b]|nr:cysteine proteinase [Rhodotorula sp. JG-1b]